MDVTFNGDYNHPNLISTQWPVIDGVKTNRPATGYALITHYGTSNITYYASPDLTWDTAGAPPSTYVINGLCGTLNNITWVGDTNTIIWSNSTSGCGGTLEYNMTINASDNITNIYVYCDDLDVTITADNIELFISSDNISFGSLDSFNSGGNNLTINKANWDDTVMGVNLFNGTGLTDTIQSIFMRFKLAIPSGVSSGTYSQSDWKIRCFKTT